MDLFKPLNINLEDLLDLAERDPLGLFNRVGGFIEGELGRVGNVRVYGRYFDPKEMDIIIEYLVECSRGEVSVKLVYSRDPSRAILKYYERERYSGGEL